MLTSQILAALCGAMVASIGWFLVYLAQERRKSKLSLRNYHRSYYSQAK